MSKEVMKKKLFISQPMRDKTDEEILAVREKAIKSAENLLGEEVEVIDSFFQNAPSDAKPLWYLGKSLELLSTADVVYFAKDWEKYRGCKIENTCAIEYGITIIEDYEDCKSHKVLKIKRGELAKQFPMPKPAKKGDVGIDIPVALSPDEDPIVIYPGERKLLPTDIRLEIPEGYWVAVEARSSTSKQLLVVPKGVIDEGYRGEIFAQIINVGSEPVVVHHGDRLVQLILQKNETNDLLIEETDTLSESERGETGFGSSGRSAI